MVRMNKINPDTHRFFEKRTGVTWVNDVEEATKPIELLDKVSTTLVGPNFKQGNYNITEQSINFKRDFFNKMQENIKPVDHDIWREVKSNYFHIYPQESIGRFMDAQQHNQLVFFDIETLGSAPKTSGAQAVQSIADGTMSPVEFSFIPFDFNGNKVDMGVEPMNNMLVQPSDAMKNQLTTIMNQISDKDNLKGLTSDQQRTLVSLMNYSDGAQFKKGELISHAFQDAAKGGPGLGHLVLDQYGTVDFSSTQDLDITLPSGETININPIEKAREGLGNLNQYGLDNNTAIKKLQNTIEGYKGRGVPFSGYNSLRFDENIINKYLTEHGHSPISMKSVDLYQTLESTINSPSVAKELYKELGVDPKHAEGGILKLETLAEQILGEKEVHRADLDNRQLAQIYGKISPILNKHIEKIGMKGFEATETGSIFEESSYIFDMMGLKESDELFATSGLYDSPVKDLDNFDMIDGVPIPKESGVLVEGTPTDFTIKDGTISKDRALIKSKESYKIGQQYTTEAAGKTFHGIELVNEKQGERVFINRESQKELQNLVHEKFEFVGNVDNDAISKMNQRKLDDLGRSRLRKISDVRKGGGYWGAKRYTKAVEKLKNAGVINEAGKFTRNISVDELKNIDGIGPKTIDKLKKEFGDNITKDFSKDKLLGISGMGETKAKTVAKYIQENAHLTDRTEIIKKVNEYIQQNPGELEEVFSFKGKHLASMQRDFIALSPRLSSEHEVWDHLIKKAEEIAPEGSAPGRVLNIQRGSLVAEGYQTYLEEMGEHREIEDIPMFQKEKAIMPLGNEEKTIPLGDVNKTKEAILFGGSGKARVGDKVDKALRRELYVDSLKGDFGKNLRGIVGDEKVDEITRYFQEDKVGRGAQELSDVLNKHKEFFPATTETSHGQLLTQQVNVESLRPRAEQVKPKELKIIEDNMKEASNKIKNMHLIYKDKAAGVVTSDELITNHVSKFLDELDETLSKEYTKHKLAENTPGSMKDVFLNYTEKLRTDAFNTETGMRILPNMSEKNPMITIALFDAESRKMYDASFEELQNNKGVGIINIPLIGKDGTISYGKQEKIAPLAFVDRFKSKYYGFGTKVAGHKDTYVHSAFDRVAMELNRKSYTAKELMQENKYLELSEEMNRAINKGLLGLDESSTYVGEHHDLTSTGISSIDSRKRESLIFERFFKPYGTYDDAIRGTDMSKPLSEVEKLAPWQVSTKALAGELKHDKNVHIDNLMKIFGEDVDWSFASSRGDSLVNHFAINLGEIRDEIPLGFLNDPGRPNMVQQLNVRGLTDEFMTNVVEKKEGFRKDSYFSAGKKIRVDDHVFDARIQLKGDYDLFVELEAEKERLLQKDVDNLSKKESKLLDKINQTLSGDASNMPTNVEDQVLVRRSLAEGKDAVFSETDTKYKTIEGKLKPEIKEHITKTIEEKGEYKLDYGEEFYDYTTLDHEKKTEIFGKKTETIITDLDHYEDGTIGYGYKERFRWKDGTKITMGSEKATVNLLDDDLMDIFTKGDKSISFIADPDFSKHRAYGDIATGYIKDAMHQIDTQYQSLDVQKAKKDKITKTIGEVFGLTTVEIDETTNTIFYNNQELKERLLEDEITNKEVAKLFDDLNKIVDNKLDKDKMMQTIHINDVNENFYAASFDKGFGKLSPDMDFQVGQELSYQDKVGKIIRETEDKEGIVVKFDDYVDGDTRTRIFKGADMSLLSAPRSMTPSKGMKLGPSELLMLKSQGLDETYDTVKKEILESTDDHLIDVVKGEYTALEQLHDPESFDAKQYKVVKNLDKEFKRLRKGHIPGSDKFTKGLYLQQEIEGSILDPKREGVVLDLQREAEIRVGPEGGTKVTKKMDKVFLPPVKESVLKDGKFAPGKVAKAQKDLYNAIIEHQDNLALPESETPVDSKKTWKNVEDKLLNFYKETSGDLADKTGAMKEGVLSSRLDGSGIGLLKTMNPVVGLDADILAKDEGLVLEKIQEHADTLYEDELQKERAIKRATDKFNVFKQASQRSLETADPTATYISKDYAMDLLGVEERYFEDPDLIAGDGELKQRIKDIKSGKGVAGQLTRFPVNFPGSTGIGTVHVSDSVTGHNIKIPALRAKMEMGDSDGDPQGIKLFKENVNKYSDDIDKQRQKLFSLFYDTSQKEMRLSEGAADSLVKDHLLKATPVEDIKRAAADSIEPFLGEEGQRMILKAKAVNPTYSGIVYNKAEQLVQMASDVYYEDMPAFKSVVESLGNLKELPISGKHATAAKIEQIDDITQQMLDGIFRGDDEGVQMALDANKRLMEASAGGEKIRLLSEEDIYKFHNLIEKGRTVGYEIDAKSSQLFLSDKLSKKSPIDVFQGIREIKSGPLTDKQKLMLSVVKDADFIDTAEELQKHRAMQIKERTGDILQEAPKKTEISENKKAQETIKELKGNIAAPTIASAGKMGFLGKAGLVGAGIFAGAMMSTSPMLPMDDPNLTQPGLQPRGNTQEMSASISQDAMDAFEYNITGNVPSTIDQDPEQLAGMVAQSLGHDSIDINLNSNDNRQEVDKEWIEEYLLSIL